MKHALPTWQYPSAGGAGSAASSWFFAHPAIRRSGIEDLSRADLLADALAVSEDVAEKITNLKRAVRRTDSVTRLPNQRYLREVLGRAILRAGESDQALSLVLMEADIRVISTLDAPAVSADILPRLARVLERNLRGTDMVLRTTRGRRSRFSFPRRRERDRPA